MQHNALQGVPGVLVDKFIPYFSNDICGAKTVPVGQTKKTAKYPTLDASQSSMEFGSDDEDTESDGAVVES